MYRLQSLTSKSGGSSKLKEIVGRESGSSYGQNPLQRVSLGSSHGQVPVGSAAANLETDWVSALDD